MYSGKNANSKTRIGKDLLIWCFVVVVMAAIAVGGVEQGPTETHEGVYAANVDAGSNEVETSLDETIRSITFKKDMRIRDALRFLALKYDKNIVPSADVDGVLAFTNLFKVTFGEAMK